MQNVKTPHSSFLLNNLVDVHVHSIHPLSRPGLFTKVEVVDEHEEVSQHYCCTNKEENGKEFKLVSIFMSEWNDKGSSDKNKWKSTKHIGLHDTESSLLDILKPMYTTHLDLENTNVDVLTPDEDIINLEQVLKNRDFPLLPNILNELVKTKAQKWHGKNCDNLFPAILSDGQCLRRNATVRKLQIICGEIRCCTGRVWYTSNMNKSEMVNSVVKAFGGNTFVEQEKNMRKKRTFVETLVQACTTVVKVDVYPVQHLQIPLASLYQMENRDHLHGKATVLLSVPIPSDTDETTTNWFLLLSRIQHWN